MKVIAEVGSNIKCLEDCIASIEAAKISGADVVKFQHFTGTDLYGPRYLGDRKLTVDIQKLAIAAKTFKIELMCTGFSPAGYRMIDPHVKRHKVASSELTAVD